MARAQWPTRHQHWLAGWLAGLPDPTWPAGQPASRSAGQLLHIQLQGWRPASNKIDCRNNEGCKHASHWIGNSLMCTGSQVAGNARAPGSSHDKLKPEASGPASSAAMSLRPSARVFLALCWRWQSPGASTGWPARSLAHPRGRASGCGRAGAPSGFIGPQQVSRPSCSSFRPA